MTSENGNGATAEPSPAVTFVVDGSVSDAARARARRAMEQLSARAPRPVIFGRVKLVVERARAAPEQAIAQGTLDVSGAVIRAEATAPTPSEAIDRLEDRLERRLRRLAERREDARERPPASPPGGWRRGDLPDVRPGFFPRPPAERRIVRRKTYVPKEVSIEEAMFDLEVLDYRFLLFTNRGVDAIVYEADGEVTLQRLSGGNPPSRPSPPVVINPAPAPVLTIEGAVARLNLSDEPFVFFRETKQGRARVLYRRYDGHYGLVEPR